MRRNGRYRRAGGALLSGVLLLSQLLAFAAAPAAACDRSTNAELLAHLGGSGLGRVVVSGTHAFGASSGALVVFDVSNAAAPSVLAQVPLPGNAEDVALSGDFVYVVGDWGEMQIVDVTDPAAPVLRGSVGWGGTMHAVGISGNRAYVTSDGHGFKVVDISDKDDPYLVSYVGPPSGGQYYDIAISGTKAYVTFGASADTVTKVRCFNIAGSTPVQVGADYLVSGLGVSVRSIVASGSLVYAAEAARGLEIVDFTTPTVPVQRGTYTFAGAGGFDLARAGDLVYLTAGDGGLKIVNVAVPSAPSLTGTLAGTFDGVALEAGKAYLTYGGTLTVADVSNPALPGALGSVKLMPAEAKDVFVSGDYVYIAAGSDGLLKTSFDATSGAEIVGRGGGTDSSKVVVSGNYAYVAEPWGVRVYDVSGPDPAEIDHPTVGEVSDMAVDGNRLYIALATGALQIIDVSTPWDCSSLGVYTDPHAHINAVAVQGDRVYAGTDGGHVVSLNAANPAAVTERDRIDTVGDVKSLSIAGGLLYAGTTQKVYKIDAGDPTDLFPIGNYYYIGHPVNEIRGAGNYAYIATDVGFYLIDFSDAANPYVATDFGEGSMPISGLDASGDVVFLAARTAGFYAVRVPVFRTSGTTRYDTAVEMSKANWDGAGNVVLATGANYADAACAAPLANELGGPLLLVHPSGIPAGVLAEIQRLAAGAGGVASMHVFIAGSTNAVPGSVEGALTGLGIPAGNIKRLAGTDRYDTARLIAREFKVAHGGNPAKAFIATGDNFPDALTVSGVAAALEAPVLLVKRTAVPAPTAAALDDLGHPALIAVGSSNVISDALYASLGCVDRLWGMSRYDTAKAVADYALDNGFDADDVIVTTGVNFPDALVSGVVSAKRGSPILLTNAGLPAPTSDFINAHQDQIKSVTVVGSAVAVSQSVEDQIVDELVW